MQIKCLHGSTAYWNYATEVWPGIPRHVYGVYPPLHSSWKSGFLLSITHYLFLTDWIRSFAIVCWLSYCQWYHTSLHPQIICCKSENSLSQWHGQRLSWGPDRVPTTMWQAEEKEAFNLHFWPTRTLHSGSPGAVKWSVIKNLKLGGVNVKLQQRVKKHRSTRRSCGKHS